MICFLKEGVHSEFIVLELLEMDHKESMRNLIEHAFGIIRPCHIS